MRGTVVFALLALAAGSAALSQQKKPDQKDAPPPPFVIPAEDAQKPNPVKATPESLAEGKKFYGYDCAICHGDSGDGKGEIAVSGNMNLKDFRNPDSLKGRTDGELYYILTKGMNKMPGDEGRMKESQRWNIINYVRSLAKKPADEPPKP